MRPVTGTNSSNRPQSNTEPKIFVVGTLSHTEKFLRCCPHASTWTCIEKETGKKAVIAIPCRRWACKWCGPKKSFHLALRCEAAQPTKLITVTTWTKNYLGPRDAYDRTRRKIADFAKRVRKEAGEFEYLRVLERHKNGFPHYHFVARCPYIKQSLLAAVWENLTGNFVVDVRAINKGMNVFKYTMKYLCKQEYVPWTTRRAAWSRNFFPKPPNTEERYNPFGDGRRDTKHPADYLTHCHQGEPVRETRPGVYILDECIDPLAPSHLNFLLKRDLACQRTRPPVND